MNRFGRVVKTIWIVIGVVWLQWFLIGFWHHFNDPLYGLLWSPAPLVLLTVVIWVTP